MNLAKHTFLDPRFKLHPFISESAKTSLQKHVEELVARTKNMASGPTDQVKMNSGTNNESRNKADELFVWDLFDSIMEKQPQKIRAFRV